MTALAVTLGCWAAGAAGAFVCRRRAVGVWLGVGGNLAGAVAAAFAGVQTLLTASHETWTAGFSLPVGRLALSLDPLAAAFLVPLAVVGALCGTYGVSYLRRHAPGRAPGGALAAYDVLILSMALVVTASDSVLLLMAWEVMTLSSWALVVSDHGVPDVSKAGLRYLVAGHLSTAALLLLILVTRGQPGTLVGPARVLPSGALFLLALVGFGTKAGITPLHVWLPDAHPAAPSHVSALMSAVMITMGFYGLARFLPLLGSPAPWWGYLLMLLGAAGAAGGAGLAIGQRDVKRLLAYSTIENAGLVTLAMGTGLLATAAGEPVLAGVAWTAALLHLWNHAAGKTLLFLGFGAIAQGADTRSLDRLGGFARTWPLVGATLVLGAAALAALPGLNLFPGEWLLVRSLLQAGMAGSGPGRIAAVAGVLAIAATGGLAVAGFTRLVGSGLSGAARSEGAREAESPGLPMVAPLLILALGCVVLAVAAGPVAGGLGSAVMTVAPGAVIGNIPAELAPLAFLGPAIGAAAVLVVLAVALKRRSVERRGTWACGFGAPSPAMQYTATSFGEPLIRALSPIFHPHRRYQLEGQVERGWVRGISGHSEVPDRVLTTLYLPVFSAAARLARRITARAQARITTALLLMGATVLIMLALLWMSMSR